MKLLGILSGLANGLFGAGGGMIAVPGLTRDGMEQKKAQATALGALLPLSLFTAFAYFTAGNVGFEALITALGALPGGFIGAKLTGKLSDKWLARLFAALMLAAGVRMCFFG